MDNAPGTARQSDEHFDVIVIGGGPAGSTVATMLCREGHKVLVLEREKFPRFHIGESLTAFAADAFKKLGVYEELKKINYVRKTGLEFVLPEKNTVVYFPANLRNEPDQAPWAFQMARGKLDKVLLDNAARTGADVRQRHAVKEVLFQGTKAVGVSYRDLDRPEGEYRQAFARWIVDTTGQAGLLNRQFQDNCLNDPLLDDKISIFTHFAGQIGIQNSDTEANFKLCVHPNRTDWTWFLPIDRDVVSIGVVLDKRSVKERNKSLEELFFEFANETPYIKDFLKNPTLRRIEKFRGVKDFSYRSRRYYGDGWALTGDAAGFLDPIFSTGLQIAFNSAFELAGTLDASLKQKAPNEALFAAYGENLNRFYRINATLVYWFYQCGIDPDRARSPWTLLTKTQWSRWKYRLKFLWYGLQVVWRPRSTVETWGREVLFGKVAPGNKIADLFLVLAQNYETLYQERMKTAPRRSFIDLET